MSYASAAQMIERYDSVRLGELVRDNGTRATAGELITDTVLQAMLDDASGLINSAARLGERYTTAQLTALTSDDQKRLVRLTADLAYGFLLRRRGYPGDQLSNLAPGFAEAQRDLDMLREGERIFNIATVADAGSAVRVDAWPNNNLGVFRLSRECQRYFGDLGLPLTPDQ